MKKTSVVVSLALLAGVIILGVHKLSGGKANGGDVDERSQYAGSSSIAKSDEFATSNLARAKSDRKQKIFSLLQSSDPKKWISVIPFLSSLSPREQWEVLSTPGIRDDFAAKAMRGQMVSSCSMVWSGQPVSHLSSATTVGQEAVAAWCADLAQSGGVEQFFEDARALASDGEFVAYSQAIAKANFGKDPSQAGGLAEAISSAQNQNEIGSAVLAAWWSGEVDGVDRGAYAALNKMQKSDIGAALPVAVTCAVSNTSCTTSNSAVIAYCAGVSGRACGEGQSLDLILRNNLSPVEYEFIQKIVASSTAKS